MDLILLIENQNGNIVPIAVDVFEINGDVGIKLPVRLALDINRLIVSYRDYELGLPILNNANAEPPLTWMFVGIHRATCNRSATCSRISFAMPAPFPDRSWCISFQKNSFSQPPHSTEP
jgi:hypothetical protein